MNLFVSLKYLVALDEHRHFGRAALACHVTQPALSNALRVLEQSLATVIVKRGRSFAGFTAEGERILLSARRMLREHELLQQDLHDGAAHPNGPLQIGAVPTAIPVAARFAALLQDRHPGIVPTVRSMSSAELETGLENLALDMGLGYPQRIEGRRSWLRVVPQYAEQYFVLRRASCATSESLQIGPPMHWGDAAQLPLCLLSAEMHNRTTVDRAFLTAGVQVRPAIETNSVLTLALSVLTGRVCSIMPGALVGAVRAYRELEALPLVSPQVEVPIAFMVHDAHRLSRTLEAALEYAQDPGWMRQVAQHASLLANPGKP